MTADAWPRGAPAAVRALVLGVGAFVLVAAVGQLAGLAVFLARGAEGSILAHTRLGWLYFEAFHGVPIEVEAQANGASGRITLGLALLLPTALLVRLMFGAGRRVARGSPGGALRRIGAACLPAPVYALASFLLSLVVSARVALPANALVSGDVELRAASTPSFVLPLLIAGAAAAAGGLASVRRPDLRFARRLDAAIRGGTRMFLLAIVLSFVGLLVNAGADPSAARTYFETIARPSPTVTAVLLGHHVLLLPNQSIWVLVPAMGGTDELRTTTVTQTLVSYGATVDEVSLAVPSGGAGAPVVASSPLPRSYLLFLLVPLGAAVAGGARAVSVARTRLEALALVVVAAAIFAALVAAGSALATVRIGATTLGPEPPGAAALAFAWGMGGGLAGAWLASRRQLGGVAAAM